MEVKNAPPAAPAESEAIGVPPVLIPSTANLAEAVDWPPIRKSVVELIG